MPLSTLPPTFKAALPSSAWETVKLPECGRDRLRGFMANTGVAEWGLGDTEANARRRCDNEKTGCSCGSRESVS